MTSFKILHVIPNLAKGGAQRLVISIAKAYLRLEKHQVKVLVFNSINDFAEDTTNLDITIIPLNYQSKFPMRTKVSNSEKFIKFLSGYNPDVIHSHLKAGDLISRIIINKKIKYFAHLHADNYLSNFNLKKTFLKKNILKKNDHILMMRLYRKTNTTFIAISDEISKKYKEILRFSRLKRNIRVLYNCTDFQKFTFPERSRKIENIKTIKLINCARNIKIKNQFFLVNVMESFNKRDEDFQLRLTILGDGVEHQNLKNLVHNLKLNQCVNFLGEVNDVENFYKSSDIYVHSALDGVFGISTIEALTTGLPIVALKGPSYDKNIVNLKNALVVENNNVELFVDEIIKLVKNKELYSSLVKNNLELGKFFSNHEYVKTLNNFYNSHEN